MGELLNRGDWQGVRVKEGDKGKGTGKDRQRKGRWEDGKNRVIGKETEAGVEWQGAGVKEDREEEGKR